MQCSQRPQVLWIGPYATRCPTLQPVTSTPVFTTTPAPSCPAQEIPISDILGKAQSFVMKCTSVKHSPVTLSFTRTSQGPNSTRSAIETARQCRGSTYDRHWKSFYRHEKVGTFVLLSQTVWVLVRFHCIFIHTHYNSSPTLGWDFHDRVAVLGRPMSLIGQNSELRIQFPWFGKEVLIARRAKLKDDIYSRKSQEIHVVDH